jgi:hypothetical protein
LRPRPCLRPRAWCPASWYRPALPQGHPPRRSHRPGRPSPVLSFRSHASLDRRSHAAASGSLVYRASRMRVDCVDVSSDQDGDVGRSTSRRTSPTTASCVCGLVTWMIGCPAIRQGCSLPGRTRGYCSSASSVSYPRAIARLGAAATMHGTPTMGATAARTSTISVAVAPAPTASSACDP